MFCMSSMDTLKRVVPVSGPEQLHQLRNLAERFEEKHYSAATSRVLYIILVFTQPFLMTYEHILV